MIIEAIRPPAEDVSSVQESSAPEILGQEILYQQGSFSRVRRYLRGWYPELGVLSQGLQGQETIVEQDVIRPIRVFAVQTAETKDFSSNGHLTFDKAATIAVI